MQTSRQPIGRALLGALQVAVSFLLLVSFAGRPDALDAQDMAVGRFDAAVPPPLVLSTTRPAGAASPGVAQPVGAVPPVAAQSAFQMLPPAMGPVAGVREPSVGLGRVVVGTALGGATGGALGALLGIALGSTESEQGGFISAQQAFGAIGFALGYTGGAAVGARRAATVDGARPGLGRTLLVSAASAALGGLVWNRTGEAFETEGSMTSWHMGAVLGVGTHWLLTALAAQSAPVSKPGELHPSNDERAAELHGR